MKSVRRIQFEIISIFEDLKPPPAPPPHSEPAEPLLMANSVSETRHRQTPLGASSTFFMCRISFICVSQVEINAWECYVLIVLVLFTHCTT